MTYDAAGRVIKTEQPSGKNQTTTYRLSGVRDNIVYRNTINGTPTGTDQFTYDEFLRPTGGTSKDGVRTVLTYTNRGQIKTETTTFLNQNPDQTYTVTYLYDDRGRLKEIGYPSGKKAQYTFEERSLLDTITWADTQIEDRDYDANGLLEGIDRPRVDETRIYDSRNLLTQINNPGVVQAGYTYDANYNKLTETFDGDVMDAYSFTTQNGADDGYDAEDRFMRFVQTNNNVSFTRNKIGNISNLGRSYSNVHELTGIDGQPQTQGFDVDGNLIEMSLGRTLEWDDAGKLETFSLEPEAKTVTYRYDVTGKRATKVSISPGSFETAIYIYAGPNCIAEYSYSEAADSPNVEFVYGQGIDSLVLVDTGNEELAVLRNQQWSVTALVDNADGAVVERYAYDHFGKRKVMDRDGQPLSDNISDFKNPYGYTSRRHDLDTGLMYFRARYYDPNTGEFISRDPLEYVDGMSLYRGYFVPGATDPSGLIKVQVGTLPPKKLNCGDGGRVSFRFELDNNAPGPGFMVQKIEVRCKENNCNSRTDTNSSNLKPDIVFWEAWFVRSGKSPLNQATGPIDFWTYGAKKGTRGTRSVIGEVRFYSLKDTGFLGLNSIPGKWPIGTVYTSANGSCMASAGKLPSTGTPPPFWKNATPIEKASFEFMSERWNCCSKFCSFFGLKTYEYELKHSFDDNEAF